ncbi:MAG: NAD-dependent epimerase/dehydratase family protein [Pseudomonadota bacterium]
MANVLVLGATGQVGIALALESLSAGHSVTGIGQTSFHSKPDTMQNKFRAVNITYEHMDIFEPRNQADLRKLFAKHDIVFHAAEPYPYEQADVTKAIRGNTGVIRTAIDAGYTIDKGNRKVFVRVGSPPVETNHDGFSLSENPYPGIPYFDAKWAMSRNAWRAFSSEGAAIMTVVFPAVFGFGANHGKLEALARYINGEFPLILSILTNAAPAAHVARGALLAAEHGSPGKTYQLAGIDVDTSKIIRHAMKCAGVKGMRSLIPTIRIPLTFMRSAAYAMGAVSRLNGTMPPELDPSSFAILANMGSRSYYLAEESIGYRAPTMTALFEAIEQQVAWYRDTGMIKSKGHKRSNAKEII